MRSLVTTHQDQSCSSIAYVVIFSPFIVKTGSHTKEQPGYRAAESGDLALRYAPCRLPEPETSPAKPQQSNLSILLRSHDIVFPVCKKSRKRRFQYPVGDDRQHFADQRYLRIGDQLPSMSGRTVETPLTSFHLSFLTATGNFGGINHEKVVSIQGFEHDFAPHRRKQPAGG